MSTVRNHWLVRATALLAGIVLLAGPAASVAIPSGPAPCGAAKSPAGARGACCCAPKSDASCRASDSAAPAAAGCCELRSVPAARGGALPATAPEAASSRAGVALAVPGAGALPVDALVPSVSREGRSPPGSATLDRLDLLTILRI